MLAKCLRFLLAKDDLKLFDSALAWHSWSSAYGGQASWQLVLGALSATTRYEIHIILQYVPEAGWPWAA